MRISAHLANLAASSAMVALLFGPVTVQAQADANGGIDVTALRKCGALLDDDARHDCTDQVMRAAGLMPTVQQRTGERRKHFGLSTRNKSKEHKAKGPKSAKNADSADLDQVELTLDRVYERGDGMLFLSTSDGGIWRPVESDQISPTPQPGRTMTVERTSLGGFRCITSRYTSFRCRRID